MAENPRETTDNPSRFGLDSDDDYYRLLADRQRRTLLVVLDDDGASTDAIPLAELADAIERREQARAGPQAAATADLRTRLHHVHLPMLEEAGVLEYDASSREVAVCDGPDGDRLTVAARAGRAD